MSLRVLHVIPAVAPRYGGPSRAVLEMSAALRARGVDVLVATTNADGDGRLPHSAGRTMYGGVPVRFFPRQWSEAFKYSHPLARWVRRHVATFDVVHIHAVFSHAGLAAAQACRQTGVPYVVRPLGSLDPWSLGHKVVRKWVLWHAGVKRLLSGAAAMHYTTTQEEAAAEGGLALPPGTVIPLGVDPALLVDDAGDACLPASPAWAAGPYVLALGRVHAKKGLELLIDAFLAATSPSSLQPWRLVVAGDGAARDVAVLQRFLRGRDHGGRVVLAGWLTGAARRATLRHAALLAQPSRQENFGLAVAEAMACRVPVLVSPHVNLAADVAAAGAGWVVPLAPEQWVAALRTAIVDTAARGWRGSAGRAVIAARFTWPVVAAALEALYRGLSARRWPAAA